MTIATVLAAVSCLFRHAGILMQIRTPAALRKRLQSGLAKAHLKRPVVEFTCYHRATQPTYREIFQYASDQPDVKFKGSVVVLANGV